MCLGIEVGWVRSDQFLGTFRKCILKEGFGGLIVEKRNAQDASGIFRMSKAWDEVDWDTGVLVTSGSGYLLASQVVMDTGAGSWGKESKLEIEIWKLSA